MSVSELKAKLIPGSRVFLSGIGGVSMSSLAEMLVDRGMAVSGSDMKESSVVAQLRSRGITVYVGQKGENINQAQPQFIVRTAAVHDDNPEIMAARAMGIPVFERAEALGALMEDYTHALCIAGTHGKTTTTSMATHITMEAGLDPTIMIGGTLPLLGSTYRIGSGDTMVAESCEYCNSFLSFRPTVAVILNIEEDHLDFFKDLEHIQRSFRQFAQLVPDDGCVVANADDANTMNALAGIDRKVVTFSLEGQADYTAGGLRFEEGMGRFELIERGRSICSVALTVPGRHNVANALAAAAAARFMGIAPEVIAAGLGSYVSADRRFQPRGQYNGADIYDDYAHHPGELQALFSTARLLGYERIICAFQPHTYTRTIACFDGFTQVLTQPDIAVLMEIFPAREENLTGISSRDLCRQIPGSIYCSTLEETEQTLRHLARPGDLILTAGAGELNLVAGRLAE